MSALRQLAFGPVGIVQRLSYDLGCFSYAHRMLGIENDLCLSVAHRPDEPDLARTDVYRPMRGQLGKFAELGIAFLVFLS